MSAYLLELGNCLPQLLKTKELSTFYKVSNCCIVCWVRVNRFILLQK